MKCDWTRTTECYSTLKTQDILTLPAALVNLQNIMLSEITMLNTA